MIRYSFANDLRAHPKQDRWPARRQTTSGGGRHEIIYTRALKPPFADTLGGQARNLNINEILYTKSCGILLMLYFCGVINVAQFWVLANVKFRKVISSETTSRRQCLGYTTNEKQPGNDRGRRSRQLFGQSQNNVKIRLLMFHRSGAV